MLQRLLVLSTLVLSTAAIAVVGLGGPAAAAPTSTTFSFTGAPETFTVPANVCQVQVTAAGAAGGDVVGPILGGQGGEAQATIAVTPGEVLQVRVGGQGVAPSASPGGDGGFNGGGDAGDGTGAAVGGAGGGGASDVRRGDFSDANRLIVGGGGGGAGAQVAAAGGAGGGTQGVAGSANTPEAGGQPGTQAGPGAGGAGLGDVAGSPGMGSEGGDGATAAVTLTAGAGGGGGGRFGGGGGSAGNSGTGGGGGGSGFTADGTGLTTGGHAGDGEVTITYDASANSCPPCPASAQSPLGGGTLAGAEGVIAAAPVGLLALFRRRARRAAPPGPSGPSRHERARSVVTWLMVAGVGIAVLAACQPIKKTPPIC